MAAIREERGCEASGPHKGPLHFHHRDPATKLFSINKAPDHAWSAVLAEMEKCSVLCAACHVRTHAALRRREREQQQQAAAPAAHPANATARASEQTGLAA